MSTATSSTRSVAHEKSKCDAYLEALRFCSKSFTRALDIDAATFTILDRKTLKLSIGRGATSTLILDYMPPPLGSDLTKRGKELQRQASHLQAARSATGPAGTADYFAWKDDRDSEVDSMNPAQLLKHTKMWRAEVKDVLDEHGPGILKGFLDAVCNLPEGHSEGQDAYIGSARDAVRSFVLYKDAAHQSGLHSIDVPFWTRSRDTGVNKEDLVVLSAIFDKFIAAFDAKPIKRSTVRTFKSRAPDAGSKATASSAESAARTDPL